jgi:hypothetical protein
MTRAIVAAHPGGALAAWAAATMRRTLRKRQARDQHPFPTDAASRVAHLCNNLVAGSSSKFHRR